MLNQFSRTALMIGEDNLEKLKNSRVIVFGVGWFGGWILMKIVGGAVINGLNTLFGTTRFTPDIIPVVCGTLAVIGSYFKTTVNNSKN